jgi:hypothetical protein
MKRRNGERLQSIRGQRLGFLSSWGKGLQSVGRRAVLKIEKPVLLFSPSDVPGGRQPLATMGILMIPQDPTNQSRFRIRIPPVYLGTLGPIMPPLKDIERSQCCAAIPGAWRLETCGDVSSAVTAAAADSWWKRFRIRLHCAHGDVLGCRYRTEPNAQVPKWIG